jgi:hypothetical protein
MLFAGIDMPEADRLVVRPRPKDGGVWTPRYCIYTCKMPFKSLYVLAGVGIPYFDGSVRSYYCVSLPILL